MTLPSAARRPSAPRLNGRKGPSVLSRAATVFLKQREASVLAIAVMLFIYFAATTHAFFSHGSFVNIAQYMAPYTIIGIGLVLLMVCGEIDLSVGFVWTLAPYTMHFFINSGIPTFLAIVFAILLLAVVVGGVNGVVTTIFGVPSLITTLGTGYIIFGYALTVSSAQQINIPGVSLGLGHWFGSEAWSEFIWATVLVLIFQVILTRTRWGLYTVSVGGNLLGAREAGIKVNRIKIGNFMLCAGLGALAGILEAFKNNIIDPSAGLLAVLLVALAGAVIGGTSMAGRLRHDDRAVAGHAGARHPAGRVQPARHQLEQVPDHPGRGDPARDDRQHLSHPAAERGPAAAQVVKQRVRASTEAAK